MPGAEFFSRFGLFSRHQFLDTDTCNRLYYQMRSTRQSATTVREDTNRYVIDREVRQAQFCEMPDDSIEMLEKEFEALLGELAEHFKISLCGFQTPQFLAYDEGGFYKAHRDVPDDPSAQVPAQGRKISIVVFVSGQSDQPAEAMHGGGELTFYGLMGDRRGDLVGFSLEAEPGLLIAFPSDMVHEVQPVVHGTRFTIVGWFI